MNLIEVRRHLHAHPELGWAEHATTGYVAGKLRELGLAPSPLPGGVGLVCEVGAGERTVLLRADLDALPIDDLKPVPYASTAPGVCHACGHDVHTAILLGVAAALAHRPPPGRVRLLFQPAEEQMPGGALLAIEAGVLDGVGLALALHCDPTLDVGHLGLRPGPITAASDRLQVELSGPGGHTSRPHNTVDLVYALGAVITGVPAALSRQVDPRSALTLVWGAVSAGVAANAVPRSGVVRGTVRTLDREAWERAPELIGAAVRHLAGLYGARAEVDYQRGVPPVVNDPAASRLLARAVEAELGPGTVVDTRQSLGGEDFGWMGEKVPAALARLGTRVPGGRTYDLHQGAFDVDERCLAVGTAALTAAARAFLAAPHLD